MTAQGENEVNNAPETTSGGTLTNGNQQPIEPEKELAAWSAQARPFQRRGREFYVTLIAIASVFGLVLFLVDGWLPVMLIIAIVFFFYVSSTIEPEVIPYKITNYGIRIANTLTDWTMLGRFWFTKRFGSEILVVEAFNISGRLEIVIDATKKDEIEKALAEYLIHEEAPPTLVDKSANWFSKRLPQQ